MNMQQIIEQKKVEPPNLPETVLIAEAARNRISIANYLLYFNAK